MAARFAKAPILVALAIALLIAPNGSGKAHPTSDEPLTFDKTEGKAPLTISMKAPKELVDTWTAFQSSGRGHNKWGDGFSIDWGDGTGDGDAGRRGPGSDSTAEIGRHTFARSGTYTITAGLYQFMPDDSHRFYWRGTATVTVRAK